MQKKKMKNAINERTVGVVGLGSMGQKIASLYIAQGYQTNVWNRTPGKAKLIEDANIASTIEEAVAMSPAVVICVFDQSAVLSIINSIPNKQVLQNKIVINLTTGTPGEAMALEKTLSLYGASLLQGALQVAPDQMGRPDTTILLSGNAAAYQESASVLSVLGGNIQYLGSSAEAASAMDFATLAHVYGGYIGLLYGVTLCQSAAIPLPLYAKMIEAITPGFTDFFKHQIGVIDRNDFTVSQSPLSISITAVERIATALEQIGVQMKFPRAISDLLQKANDAGLQDKEAAVLIKIIQGN